MQSNPKNFQTKKSKNFQCTEELVLAESFLKYHNIKVVEKITKYFEGALVVLDFGAGIGTLADLYKRLNNAIPECVEIDKKQRHILKVKGYICYSSINFTPKKYDAIYSCNVLEHIQDDRKILNDLYKKLKPGGIVSIYVPACMSLYNYFDSYAGHYRRYEKKELVEKMQDAKFNILNCEFSDSIGYFSWLFVKYFGDKNITKLASEKQLIFYDKYIYPFSLFIDSLGAKYFFGKSLIITAKK